MKKALLILPVLFMLIAPAARAEDIWTMAQSPSYGRKAGGMFVRGLLNLSTCFVDLIVSTVDGTKNGPPFVGTVTGLGKGLGCTAIRALSGALDLTTFWVPGFNGFAPCKSYADCINCAPQAGPSAPAPPPPAYTPPPAVIQAPAPAPAQEENPMRYVKK